jgi:hypothetical protein
MGFVGFADAGVLDTTPSATYTGLSEVRCAHRARVVAMSMFYAEAFVVRCAVLRGYEEAVLIMALTTLYSLVF